VTRRSDEDFLDSVLRRIAPKSVNLSIDDIAGVVGDALKDQRQKILGHVRRMIEMERLNSAKSDIRFRNLHARMTAAESAIWFLQKDRSRGGAA
jgi:hypothetical protein